MIEDVIPKIVGTDVAIRASNSSGFRLSTRCWDLAAKIRSHSGPTLMLGFKVWLTVGVPVHPKGVGRG